MFELRKIFSIMLALALAVVMIPETVFATGDDLVPGSTTLTLSISISNITDQGGELTFEVTDDDSEYTVKYLVLKASEDKPNVDTIKNTGKTVENNIATITALIPETAYTVYGIVYVNDADGNPIFTDISEAQFTTLKGETPAVPIITGATAELADGNATLTFTTDKSCTYYYLVYEEETAAPDAQEIKAQGEAVAKGSGTVNANENAIVSIIADFDLNKAYTLYLAVEDENGAFSKVSILTLALSRMMLDAAASDSVTIDIETVTGNGTGYTYSGGILTIIESGSYVITGSGTSTANRIKINSGLTADITLNNVNIDVSSRNVTCAFDMAGATVTLTLMGDITLKSGNYCAGLQVSQGAALTISADSTGTITATGGNNGAGIGGANDSPYSETPNNDNGKIIIDGGIVNAYGTNGAGIGGGNNGTGGNIIITGGTVNANGGEYSAGIGGGYYKGCGTVLVQGGVIHATGGSAGPGIGCGFSGDGGNITISGGEIYANGGDSSAGIGAGSGAVSVVINDGIVKANGGVNGAGIGGGELIGPTPKTGDVYITGGDITATGGEYAAGIGASTYRNSGRITIEGGTIIATGKRNAAGIGGANDGDVTDPIIIKGGNVTATGGQSGAGIGAGGGDYARCGDVTITGGQVSATGGMYAAGIGGGGGTYASTCGIVSISGPDTVVNAKCDTAMDDAKDIGAGHKFDYMTTIQGGTLKLDGGATLNFLARGTNSSTNYIMGIIGGEGAGPSAGIYYYGNKYKGVIDVSAPGIGWYKGSGYTFSGDTVNIGEAGSYCVFGSTALNRIKISNTITADITLSDASIDVSGIPNACAFDMIGATVNLTLTGDNELASGENCAGLLVPSGAVLTVLKASTGSLSASGGTNGAGIGGGAGGAAGNITILGGEIEVRGGEDGAGIGGGSNASGGIVKIGGGADTFVSCLSPEGYDIGSGYGNSTGGSLEVNNGAMVGMRNYGTNAAAKYITCTIDGNGAKLDAGVYLNSQKQLVFDRFLTDHEDGAKAYDTITLAVLVNGLSQTAPEGTIVFKANGVTIGQSSITHFDELPSLSMGAAIFEWTDVPGGTQTLTAEYKQNEVSDSYYAADSITIVNYEIAKINQSELVIKIPEAITYGDEPFNIDISGGSGTGTLSYQVTTGDAVSVDSSGLVTVEGAGTATITVTKSADAYYLENIKSVNIVVTKANPPAVVFPTAGEITYGQRLSAAALSGGNGDGTFAWSSPDTVAPVKNSGYIVVFTPNDTDNYDYTGVELEKLTGVTVHKASPETTFPTAGAITYGQSLADAAFSGESGDGSFAWEHPDTVPPVVNEGYKVIFTPNDTDNYLPMEQIIAVTVHKANQTPLSVSGIPAAITYGDSSFNIETSGGSGTGVLTYEVTSGDAVTVDSSGKISVMKAGEATLTVTNSGDSNYLTASKIVEISVSKATPEPVVFPSSNAITYGDKLIESALTGGSGDGTFAWVSPDTIPTVRNDGYAVVFTPNDINNYDYTGVTVQQITDVTVYKAIPAATFPTAGEITYGQRLSDSSLSGGSGEGYFAWEYPDQIPSVHNEGYNVLFTPSDTDNYLVIGQVTGLTVHMANQTPLAADNIPYPLTYSHTPFALDINGGSGTGAVSFEVVGDAVTVDATGLVTIAKVGTATITVTKAGDDNYLKTETTIPIEVHKADQVPLSVSGIPSSLTFGHAPFTLILSGGSGTGGISFEASEGGAVTVDVNGKVTIVKTGSASITITKAEDTNYHMAQKVINLTVRKASSGDNSGSTYGETPSDTYVQNECMINTNSTVTIDLTKGSTLLSSAQINTLISLNQTRPIIFIGNGYHITFPVGTMRAAGYTDLNLGVYFNSGSYYDRIKAISSDSFVLMMDFEHSGSLPGEAQVKIKVGVPYAGKTLYYHFYNPQTGNLEYLQTITVDREGYVIIVQSHCSAYALNTTISGNRPSIPETGGGDIEPNSVSASEEVVIPVETSRITTLPIVAVKPEMDNELGCITIPKSGVYIVRYLEVLRILRVAGAFYTSCLLPPSEASLTISSAHKSRK